LEIDCPAWLYSNRTREIWQIEGGLTVRTIVVAATAAST
jgi:hypothetical protein